MKDLSLSMGWIKDYPDIRDYSPNTEKVLASKGTEKDKEQVLSLKGMLEKVGVTRNSQAVTAQATVDLREWCSPIENQGSLGSCTANAAVGALEYFEKRAFGKHLEASRLFLYKTTRNLLNWTGDTGAYLRSTMASMAIFGIALEKYWPYDISRYENEPTAFIYAMGQNYRAVTYYRLDPQGTPFPTVLQAIKTQLEAGLPSMFGFTCYSSLYDAVNGKIPYPLATEKVVGGHAVLAVGYDDNIVINNGATKTTGALLIRNSWGTGWGMSGYGYLPYEYVLKGLAVDFWVLIKNDWIDTGNFGL
jgi:C1A family cysteine protease